MKIAMICFTLTGWQTGEMVKEGLEKTGHQAEFFCKSRYLPRSIKESTKDWAKEQFEKADGLIFMGATGIAVRSIAPYVQSKKKDPAVLVIDECGKFVISLLSGHLGGANKLALQAAEILGAIPVVTTATDLHEKFAVDVFAKQNNCHIFRMKEAKEVSAALLAGKQVGFYSDFPWEGELPEGLIWWDGKEAKGQTKPEIGIAVTIHKNCQPFQSTTHVVPQAAVLGMGCRKGKEPESVERAALECLQKNQIYPEAIWCLASIDVKKEEAGLLALSEKLGIPFLTFSSEELLAVEGEFTSSAFVKQTVGVDNVCERSALKAAYPGHIIQKKQGKEGVTTALAQREWRICFE